MVVDGQHHLVAARRLERLRPAARANARCVCLSPAASRPGVHRAARPPPPTAVIGAACRAPLGREPPRKALFRTRGAGAAHSTSGPASGAFGRPGREVLPGKLDHWERAHLDLMDNHRLVGEVDDRLRHCQRQRPQPCAVPAWHGTATSRPRSHVRQGPRSCADWTGPAGPHTSAGALGTGGVRQKGAPADEDERLHGVALTYSGWRGLVPLLLGRGS